MFKTIFKCNECGRVFDLHNEVDADEFAYGHDCEQGDDTNE